MSLMKAVLNSTRIIIIILNALHDSISVMLNPYLVIGFFLLDPCHVFSYLKEYFDNSKAHVICIDIAKSLPPFARTCVSLCARVIASFFVFNLFVFL